MNWHRMSRLESQIHHMKCTFTLFQKKSIFGVKGVNRVDIMKKYSVIAGLLFASLFCFCSSLSANTLKSDNTKSIPGKLKPIAELVTSDMPWLSEAVRLIPGSPCSGEYDHDKYACFEGEGYSVTYCKDLYKNRQITYRVEINIPEVYSSVALNDIVSIFGKWTLVGPASKFSLVKFLYTNPQNKQSAIIFADLYDPPTNPKSPVMGIVIQKVDPSMIKE